MMGLDADARRRAGIRLMRIAAPFPLDDEAVRSFADFDKPVNCPQDGAVAERLFRPSTGLYAAGTPWEKQDAGPSAGSFAHHGHTHGPGGHTH